MYPRTIKTLGDLQTMVNDLVKKFPLVTEVFTDLGDLVADSLQTSVIAVISDDGPSHPAFIELSYLSDDNSYAYLDLPDSMTIEQAKAHVGYKVDANLSPQGHEDFLVQEISNQRIVR